MTVKMLRACAEVVENLPDEQIVSVTEIGSEGVIVGLREPLGNSQALAFTYPIKRYNVARDGSVREI